MVFRSFHVFVALLLLSASAAKADAGTAKCPNGTMRVLVTPFMNDAKAKSLSALSFAIPAHVAEMLEGDPCVTPIVGDATVLTEEVAQLATPGGKEIKGSSEAAANRLAVKLGATHILFGTFTGQVWEWRMSAALCKTVPGLKEFGDGVFACGDGTATGSLVETVSYPNGKTGQLQSSARLHETLAAAVQTAFADAHRKFATPLLATTTVGAIATPPAKGSKEFYPELLLARAYVRYFQFEIPRKRMFAAAKTWTQKAALLRIWRAENSKYTAMGLAASAVRNDPTYVQAQRFYASLAEQSLTLKNPKSMARIHYEAALASDSRDYRTLMAVGALELGDGHGEVARGYYLRASEVRPLDARPLHQLGMALLSYGQTTNAMQAFLKARTVDPTRNDSRKELALLFAKSGRYADAAQEYREVVRNAPDDTDARFALAASWRAAGGMREAQAAYASIPMYGAQRSDKKAVARAEKFRGDLYTEEGDAHRAHVQYVLAAQDDPSDRRVQAILSEAKVIPLGGKALRDATIEAEGVAAQLEDRHARFQVALNDAVADLRLNGGEGCKDGHGASSALLADSEGKKHGVLLSRLAVLSNAVQTAFRTGEDAALTPDEKRRGLDAFAALKMGSSDAREMRAQYVRAFLPLYNRNKCGSYDGPVSEATFDAVIARNDVRTIDPPKVPPAQSAPMYFSPEIPSESAFGVSITVDNRDGGADYDVALGNPDTKRDEIEWKPLGTVEAGKTADFPALIGLYRVCIVPQGAKCGDDDAERIAYLHDGWEVKIRGND